MLDKLTAPYYIRQNMELVLGSNRRTLDYRLKQLIKDGVLEPIKPGFYLNKLLLAQTAQKESLLEYVGSVLKFPSYVSLEYALAKYGVIPESIFALTYITSKKTAEYSSESISYRYRNIKTDLFGEYEQREFEGKTYYFAKKWKALFDYIYLTKMKSRREYLELLLNSRINWQMLQPEELDQLTGYCLRSGSQKMSIVVKLLKEEGIV